MTRWMTLAESWFTDGAVAERLCLTLAHSLWQFGVLAVLAWCVSSAGRRLSHAARYNLCVFLLAGGLLAVPITWASLADNVGSKIASLAATVKPAQTSPITGPATSIPAAPGEQLGVQHSLGETPEQTASSPVAAAPEAARPNAALAAASGWIAALYAAGVGVMIVRLLRGMWRNHRLAARSQSIAGHALEAVIDSLAARWKLRIRPRLALANDVAMPCVMGLLRPAIVFPLAALSSLSPQELEMILAHELAHVRRGDLWVHLAQRVAEAVLFFNPGVWYLSRRISLLREHCCDELACERATARLATADTQAVRLGYARALVRLAELQFAQTNRQALAKIASLAAAGGSPSQLRRRIAVLLGEPVRQPLRISRAGAMSFAVVLAALLLVPAVVVSSDQPSEPEPPTATPGFPTDAAPAIAEPGFPRQVSDNDAPPADDRFVKKLSSGVEVKLLAIGTRGEPTQRWWRPDGEPLEGEPYHVKDFERVDFPGPLSREAVFSMKNVPEDAKWQFVIRESNGVNGQGGVADAKGNRLRHHHAHVASLPADTQTFRLEVGVGAGEWKTVASANLRNISGIGAYPNRGVIFSGPFTTDRSGGWLSVSHALSEQTQLVVVGSDGSRQIALQRGSTNTDGNLRVDQFSFKIGGQSIEAFEFQTRPFEWAVFEDLPVEAAPVTWNANYSVDRSIQVLAIGYGENVKQTGPRWWNMDGTPCEAPMSKFQGRRNPQLMPSDRARQIVFELPNYTRGAAVRYEIKSKSGWSRGELTNSERELDSGKPLRMHEVHTISYDDEGITLRVGRADGEWKSVYQGQAGAVAQGNNELKGVVFSGAFLQDGAAAVAVSHNWHGQSTRLVAIDKAGQKHTGKMVSQLTAVETVNQTIFAFEGLKPDDIRDFDFQVQDFTWTTIEGVPVNPKPAADAKATISGRIKLPDGSPATERGTLYYHLSPRDSPTTSGISGLVGRVQDHYSFEVPAGTLWLAHFTKQHAPAVVGFLEVKPGEKLSDTDLVLQPGVTAKLKFEDEAHRAVLGVQVVLIPSVGEDTFGQPTTYTADGDGIVAMPRVAKDIAHKLFVRAPGHQPYYMLPVQWDADSPFPSPLVMRKARPATGRLVGSDGNPAAGAVLEFRNDPGGLHVPTAADPFEGVFGLSLRQPRQQVKVGDDGRYSIDQLVDGADYLVLARAADGARRMLPAVVAGQSDVEIVIPPRRDLTVHFTGNLDKLEKRNYKRTVRIGQHYKMPSPRGPGFSDYLGETVRVHVNDNRGLAIYRGLIDAPITVTVGKQEYKFDGSESEVTIKLDGPPDKSEYQNRY